MVEVTTTLAGLSAHTFWIAQAPVIQEPINTGVPPEAASVLISGPQFFIALLSGLLLAFAFQLVFTNLSVAAGISILGRNSNSSQHDDDGGGGISVRKISFGVGIWTLITVTLALFAACFLAVQLSLVTSANLGAIIGLVIWAAYFSLLVWFSSTTVSSLIGSVVNAATSGFQSILGTATAVIGSQAAKRQAVSTAEAVASAVRHELGAGIDPANIRNSIESYFQRLQLPGFDFHRIRQDLVDLLNDPEIQTLAEDDRLRHIDRQTFLDLISKRTDFSREEVNRLADLLEGAWQQAVGQRRRRSDSTAELVEYLRSTQPGQLRIEELNAKIDRLLAEREQSKTNQAGMGTSAMPAGAQGVMQQTLQFGMNTLIGLLVGRTDLSDLDLQNILGRLQEAPSKLAEQRDKLVNQVQGAPEPAYSPIRTDVDHYLMNAHSWQMTPERVAREFREVLYDPDADPAAVADQLSQLDRNYFVERLSSRGVFTQDRIQQLADTLESIRLEVIAAARVAKEREIALDLRQRIGSYLTLTPREQLHAVQDGILPEFQAILQDEDADYETLRLRLSSYDRDTLRQMLWQRADLTPEETESILDQLEATRDRVLSESQSSEEQARQRVTAAQQKLEDYLRNTGKAELNPEGIKRDLQLLVSDPQLGLSALRNRAAHVDRDTLVRLLSQREDISEAEAYQIVDQVESNWKALLSSPRVLTEQVKSQYDQTLNSIADYLRRTNLEELNPEGIQRDLTTLLEDPKEGTLALRRRLSQIDRQTLVRLLGQREGMSEAQVNRTIDQLQEGINRIVKSPRRLALRAQQQVMDFEASIEDYLRNTNKEELSPEGIKRDFSLLLQSPQLGLQSLSERISRFDRSTLVALLAQRQDMTPEEANRVVMQIESVRDQVLDQMRQIQHRIQSVIDRIFDRIRNYLNSLNRPELNYESIRQDVRTLFDDPQAGFEALRQRLSQFDRGTLVALLSSRKDISEADANRLIDQVESARNSVLQRAERIQMEAQQRLEEVKYQAQRQVEETRKAAATAAWWLFITALVSAAAAAGAGALASI
jgi:nucleoid DNA-binding protein